MMTRIYLLTAILLILLITNSEASDFALPSGEVLKIKSIYKTYLLKDDPALTLEYETTTNLKDTDLLRRNAESIWPFFRENVNKENMVNAVIKATTPKVSTSPITYKTQSYSFVITQKPNQTWNFINWGKDYRSEASVKSEKFIKYLRNIEANSLTKVLHFPSDFNTKKIDEETKGIKGFIEEIFAKTGVVLSYELNIEPIKYKYLYLQTASEEYWRNYPIFLGEIYNLNYSKWGLGYLIIRYSIIDNNLEINSVLFGFPENDNKTEILLKDIHTKLAKQ